MGCPPAVVFFLLFLLPVCLSLPNSEVNALTAMKTRLSDPYNVLQSWDPTLVNPCTWFHVTCNSDNIVVRLDLGNANLSGTIGPELGELRRLQYLELYDNNIGGKIPKQLGKLSELVSLDLYGNKFDGKIPNSLANLKSLKYLRLNDNMLSGSIPKGLATLSKLQVFDVSNNDLHGKIPTYGAFKNFPLQSFVNNKLCLG